MSHRNDLLTALTLTPALAVALWLAFEARHGVTIIQSLSGM